jgi:hypothetical protein
MARTISNTYNAGITLTNTANNPVSVTGRISVASGTALTGKVGASYSWTIDNSGTIISTPASEGIFLGSFSGTIASGTITNETGGLISSGGYGVFINGPGSITNKAGGTIVGTLFKAVYVRGGLGTIVNGGVLQAGNVAAYEYNGGSITNLAGGTITGAGGVWFQQPGTFTNGGVVIGTHAGFGSVLFNSTAAANRLIVDPGATFTGNISSLIGGTNVVELASAASAGTLSCFGTSITNFTSLQFDAGANWIVTGNASNAGLGTLAITGFTANDTIDLTGFVATSETFAGNALVLTNASTIHPTLHIQGAFTSADFTIAPDTGNGTDITMQTGLRNPISATYSSGITLPSSLGSSISVTGTITPTSGIALYGPGDGTNTWTIDNAGLISASDTSSYGIILGGSSAVVAGVVTNRSGGTITGGSIAVSINDTSQAVVTNAGGEIAGANYGVSISGVGTVSNMSGGSIIGTSSSGTNAAGVFIYGYGASGNQPNVQIYNAGSLSGATGVEAFLGGTITNVAGGTIDGRTNFGVFLDGNGTLVNGGTISGAGVGADLYEGGLVQNLVDGTISGSTGIYFGLLGGTVTNAGTVIGTSGDAVNFSAYGAGSYRLIADPGAVFGGGIKGGGGVLELAAGNGAGSLSGIGTSITNFTSLQFDTGSPWSVSGNAAGLAAIGPITGFTAHDTIDLTDFAATSISFASGALTLTNSAAATTVLNFPDQTSSAAFAFAPDGAGGTDIAGAPGTFNWIGSTGDWNTPSAWDLGSVPTRLDNATIAQAGTNTITISQAESIANLALGGANDTVSIPGGGFLQAGSITIAGTLTDTGGFAASQVTDDGLLNIITDATQTLDITPLFLGGTLLVSSAFDLPGTLMLGTNETVTQTGISALITSSGNALNEVLNNGTIDAAFSGGILTIAPQNFLNQGTIVVSNTDTLSATSGISAGMGSGTIEVSTGGVADFAGTVAATETLAFTDATGVLRLHQPTGFAATIDGFATDDTIDLAGITANAAVWSGGTLTISNAGCRGIVAAAGLLRRIVQRDDRRR